MVGEKLSMSKVKILTKEYLIIQLYIILHTEKEKENSTHKTHYIASIERSKA